MAEDGPPCDSIPDDIWILILSGGKTNLGALSVLCGIGHTNRRFRRLALDARLWSAQDFEFLPIKGIFSVLRLLNSPDALESFSLRPFVRDPSSSIKAVECPLDGPDAPWPGYIRPRYVSSLQKCGCIYGSECLLEVARFASRALSPVQLKELRLGISPVDVVRLFIERPFSALTSLSCKLNDDSGSLPMATAIQTLPLSSLSLLLAQSKNSLLLPIVSRIPTLTILHLEVYALYEAANQNNYRLEGSTLEALSNLTRLDLSLCQFGSIDGDLGRLPRLRRLTVALQSDQASLKLSSPSLETIEAHCHHLDCHNCPSLTTLVCSVQDDLALVDFPHLETVDIQTRGGLECCACPSLTTFKCSAECDLTLVDFPRLETIDIRSSWGLECRDCPSLMYLKCSVQDVDFTLVDFPLLETIDIFTGRGLSCSLECRHCPSLTTFKFIVANVWSGDIVLHHCPLLRAMECESAESVFINLKCKDCASLTTVTGVGRVTIQGECPPSGLLRESSYQTLEYLDCPCLSTVITCSCTCVVQRCPLLRTIQCTTFRTVRLECQDCPSLTMVRCLGKGRGPYIRVYRCALLETIDCPDEGYESSAYGGPEVERTLHSYDCPSLKAVDGFNKIMIVGACHQTGVSSLSSLNIMYKDCFSLKDVKGSEDGCLTVEDCLRLETIDASSCRKLQCSNCPCLVAIRHLKRRPLESLKVVDCALIETFQLYECREIVFYNCISVRTIKCSLRGTMSLRHCPRLVHMDITVPYPLRVGPDEIFSTEIPIGLGTLKIMLPESIRILKKVNIAVVSNLHNGSGTFSDSTIAWDGLRKAALRILSPELCKLPTTITCSVEGGSLEHGITAYNLPSLSNSFPMSCKNLEGHACTESDFTAVQCSSEKGEILVQSCSCITRLVVGFQPVIVPCTESQ